MVALPVLEIRNTPAPREQQGDGQGLARGPPALLGPAPPEPPRLVVVRDVTKAMAKAVATAFRPTDKSATLAAVQKLLSNDGTSLR